MCGEVSGRKPADWTLDRASTPVARRAPRCCLFLAFKKLPALERGAPVPQNKPGPRPGGLNGSSRPGGFPAPSLVTSLSTTDSAKEKQPK